MPANRGEPNRGKPKSVKPGKGTPNRGEPNRGKPTAQTPEPSRVVKKLKIGQNAPNFTLPSSTGGNFNLSEFQRISGKNVVLYFYPRDNTPGCTAQACDFRDNIASLTSADTVVLGVSTDSLKSHEKFVEKFSLPFPLLADEEHVVAEKYGVWGEKKNYGKTYMGLHRSTFLIDKAGKVQGVWTNVKVKGHVAEVAAKVAELHAAGQ